MPTEHDLDFANCVQEMHFASEDQVNVSLENLRKMEEMEMETSLGEVMIKKGFISRDQARAAMVTIGYRGKQPIPGYEIVEKIAQGGWGSVYKAKQKSTDRMFALKVLPPKLSKDNEIAQRFMREARMVAKLNHPNIVSGIETGESGGYHYLVLEYVEGRSLGEMVEREGALPEEKVIEYMIQAAKGLDRAFKKNMIHRDIKPDNIMITNDGVIKIADFGLAKSLEDTARLTSDGTTFGTPKYISPEQARGNMKVDIRSDIYSLGATMFHLVTGQVPYDSKNPLTIMNMHINSAIPDPRNINPNVSQSLSLFIKKVMAKEPENRFQTPQELIDVLNLCKNDEYAETVMTKTEKLLTNDNEESNKSRAVKEKRPDRKNSSKKQVKGKRGVGFYIMIATFIGLLVGALLMFLALYFSGKLEKLTEKPLNIVSKECLMSSKVMPDDNKA